MRIEVKTLRVMLHLLLTLLCGCLFHWLLQVPKGERINGSTAEQLLKYGVVEVEEVGMTRLSLSISKLLLRVLCNYRRPAVTETRGGTEDENPPESAYLPPDEVLRTIRDYSSDMQELAHIWSFVVNFNARASLAMPIEGTQNKTGVKSRVRNPVTMAALRPGAVLLEPAGVSLLTEELKVKRVKGTGAPKPQRMMRVVSWLEEEEGEEEEEEEQQQQQQQQQHQQQREIKDRVALHDIVNQDRFTAGLTIAGSEGIDAWARVWKDKVVLFQTKGQQKGSAVGRPGNNAVLQPGELHKYIASLMISAYASADNLVKQKIRAFSIAKSEETRADCQTQLVCSCVLNVCLRACVRVYA